PPWATTRSSLSRMTFAEWDDVPEALLLDRANEPSRNVPKVDHAHSCGISLVGVEPRANQPPD
ncbi:MAG TPA: hypothetical protein VGY54_09365, partial [Polyangiaceae bacterium]|nr:hypothetical protein [Polyangiaceae bacterium]